MNLIDYLDYLVLIFVDFEVMEYFYVDVLGMMLEIFGEGCKVFCFGNQKINLYVCGKEFEFKVYLLVLGVLDFCFMVLVLLEQVIVFLQEKGWLIIEGLVLWMGVMQKIWLVYVWDLDLNLIEILELVG